jgi:hypothetical protein
MPGVVADTHPVECLHEKSAAEFASRCARARTVSQEFLVSAISASRFALVLAFPLFVIHPRFFRCFDIFTLPL